MAHIIYLSMYIQLEIMTWSNKLRTDRGMWSILKTFAFCIAHSLYNNLWKSGESVSETINYRVLIVDCEVYVSEYAHMRVYYLHKQLPICCDSILLVLLFCSNCDLYSFGMLHRTTAKLSSCQLDEVNTKCPWRVRRTEDCAKSWPTTWSINLHIVL
jgi:hypothetical protein